MFVPSQVLPMKVLVRATLSYGDHEMFLARFLLSFIISLNPLRLKQPKRYFMCLVFVPSWALPEKVLVGTRTQVRF